MRFKLNRASPIYIYSFLPPPPHPAPLRGAVGWGRKGTFPEGRAIVFQIDAFSIFAFPLPLGVDSSNEDKPVKLYVVKEYL